MRRGVSSPPVLYIQTNKMENEKQTKQQEEQILKEHMDSCDDENCIIIKKYNPFVSHGEWIYNLK